MPIRALPLIIAVALTAGLTAQADEPRSAALVQTLPPDGSWVNFNVKLVVLDQDFELTAIARSVGKATYEGKQCRYIEYEQSNEMPPGINLPQLGNLTWRMLVPDEEFGEGKDPLRKAVKTWVKYDKMEPEAVESIEHKDPYFAVLFQGPRTNLKIQDAKEKIIWQRGELECTVITGQNDLDLAGVKLAMTHRIFRNRDVPFGIGAVQQDLKVSLGGQEQQVTIRASLRDFGKDAKAKLPELVP